VRPCVTRTLLPDEVKTAARLLAEGDERPDNHARMQFAYALPLEPGIWEVRYVLARAPRSPFAVWRVRPVREGLPSLTPVYPLLGWYEREMSDLYGLRFEGHPEPLPLVFHEGTVPPGPSPRRDDEPPHAPFRGHPALPAGPRVIGPDVQRLPFGPVRADVVESARFVFFTVGEGVLHYRPHLFYKHRGMEARFAEADLATGGVLAERISGVDSVAHALAYAQGVEAALGWRAPRRARLLRVLLAELERLYNHLHYMAYLAKTTTLKVAEAQGLWLEEQVKQVNGRLSGSRFLRGLIVPGGLRRDLETVGLDAHLKTLEHDVGDYLHRLETTGSHLDRLLTTGVLERRVAFDQGATGPVERASGLDRDLRRDHPYAAYDALSVAVPVAEAGDAHARSLVRAAEIRASFALLHETLDALAPGAVRRTEVVDEPDAAGEGLGWVEGTRGSLFYAVRVDPAAGRMKHVKIKDPSFSNWRVFPFTVENTNMMDYAINEASFGLSVAGADR
jgi:formate hydrogenlyase subunit 5